MDSGVGCSAHSPGPIAYGHSGTRAVVAGTGFSITNICLQSVGAGKRKEPPTCAEGLGCRDGAKLAPNLLIS